MGERYLITGVQLGMFQVYCKEERTAKVKELIDEIIDKQFIGKSSGLITDDVTLAEGVLF